MRKYKGLFTFDEDNHKYIPIAQADGLIDTMDYEPDFKTVEPLIKDEKIRKAVRAWAEINNFDKVKLLVSPEYGSQFEGGYGFGRITFSGKTLGLGYPKEYTIAELCGEEEE